MRIQSVLISLLALFATEVYAESDVCGNTKLTASSTQETLKVQGNILTTETTCQYIINGAEGEFVKIEFNNPAPAGRKPACDKPFVKLEGVTGEIKTEIAMLCDLSGDKIYYSPGPQMIVTIQGKADSGAQPFDILYESVPAVENTCGKTALTADTSDSSEWTAPTKDLQVNQICVYTITAKPGEVVHLQFTKIAGSSSQQASAAGDASKPLIRLENFKDGVQTLIADIPPGERDKLEYNSTDETMIVTLFGSATLVKDLFTAVYKSVTDPYCGPVVLKANEESTMDWKFPLQTLTSARNCTYKIEASSDQTVRLNITTMDFTTKTKNSKCSAPYLKVENVGESGNEPIEDVCDTKLSHTISSTTPAMGVKLYGVANLKQHAVTATYKAVKGAANNELFSFSSFLMTALLCRFQF